MEAEFYSIEELLKLAQKGKKPVAARLCLNGGAFTSHKFTWKPELRKFRWKQGFTDKTYTVTKKEILEIYEWTKGAKAWCVAPQVNLRKVRAA